MGTASIPVDLFNPGQVFACLGFLEAADVLLGNAEGGFDWRNETDVRFHLSAKGDESPVTAVLEFLSTSTVSSIAPRNSQQRTERWNVPTIIAGSDAPFSSPDPRSPATLPARLRDESGTVLEINHWGEAASRTGRDTVKFWAGSGGYPGAALARDALDLIRGKVQDACDDPFSLAVPQSSSFRFDWRRDYIPIDVGFSPNDHADVTMLGFPLVEILAAIGLTNARPDRLDRLTYRYGVIGTTETQQVFGALLLRAALGACRLPLPQRFFRMQLGWPGQENQARCIIDIVEEIRA